jgi:NADH:ubiquinone oxidoreductase subunit F (NADH-binding)/NADH:ubiquinone oxidoreductase subunit E
MTNKKIIFKPISPKVEGLIKELNAKPSDLLEILVELNTREGVLTRETMDDVARSLEIPSSRIYEVASFYSMLEVGQAKVTSPTELIRVCDGPVCWLSRNCTSAEYQEQTIIHSDWKFERSSCLGLCDRAPAALANHTQIGSVFSNKDWKISIDDSQNGVDYSVARPGEVRVLLENCGKVDPDSIQSAIFAGAYKGLQKALQLTSDQVILEVENSHLLGRGGAGFPVGKKWRYVAEGLRTPKFIVCNADESEPLIFKDRVLIDTNPHQILEGMAIAGYATGANTGYIYIRGEYASQATRLENAIVQAEKEGWLGKNIAGTKFSFNIHIHCGAGAYICGEETALLESLEGRRGEPRFRPPYPPTAGYLNFPTVVNNVESFACVPSILRNGSEWYNQLSGNSAGGTKLFMILGHINKPGLFEAPFGLTLRQIINDFGGGMRAGSKFHFALCGGAAGTIVDNDSLDVPIDYNSAKKGISLGAGAFLVCDETVSPVAMLRELLHFFTMESCGKCTPCREGTSKAYEILIRLSEGRGFQKDVADLIALADVMGEASFCGLGQSVQIPIKSAISHFANEFETGLIR